MFWLKLTVKAIDGSNITTTVECCVLKSLGGTCLTPNTKDQFIPLATITILFTMLLQMLALSQNTLISRITTKNNV